MTKQRQRDRKRRRQAERTPPPPNVPIEEPSHESELRPAAKVYPPVGCCIYCGGDGGKEGRLDSEHIIPKGLQGAFILPRASCIPCARKTSAFETTCLQKTYIDYRLLANCSMSRPVRDRPKDKKLVAVICFPDIPLPRFLASLPPDNTLRAAGLACYHVSKHSLVGGPSGNRSNYF